MSTLSSSSPSSLCPCFLSFLLFLLLLPITVMSMRPVIPRTEKTYTIHVQSLSEGLNDAKQSPTLVSVTEMTSLWLPRGSAADNDVHLSFNEDLDSFWVYLLRRRHLDSLEWSGCGGLWRPEWTKTIYEADSPINESTVQLIYDLSHHTACYFSSLSACGRVTPHSTENISASQHDDAARRHHQWLAQFVSSLLSSPLSWISDTPRHLRPVGTLGAVHERDPKMGLQSWCSYHLAQHDTVCTQHVSAVLNGGRSGKGVEERIPEGIFRGGFEDVQQFFSSKFHHFSFRASQTPTPADNEAEETEIKLSIRMAFVASVSAFPSLAQHWKAHLPKYADRLEFVLSPDVNEKLKDAIDVITSSKTHAKEKAEEKVKHTPDTVPHAPTARHYILRKGHDHGTYSLVIHPSLASTEKEGLHASSGEAYGLRAGDTLDSLLFFPLHVIRPSLHAMVAEIEGSSHLEDAFFDDSSNVVVVRVKTVLTEEHFRVTVPNTGGTLPGFVVCQFPFQFGWAALKDMPNDANSNRILPQPVIRVGRRMHVSKKDCTHCAAQSYMRIDHQDSLERLMEREGQLPREEPRTCYYWLRCSNFVGTTIPVPDPAMVFNVVSLGLVYTALAASGITRITRSFFENTGKTNQGPNEAK